LVHLFIAPLPELPIAHAFRRGGKKEAFGREREWRDATQSRIDQRCVVLDDLGFNAVVVDQAGIRSMLD
jgi:hypothetical protein